MTSTLLVMDTIDDLVGETTPSAARFQDDLSARDVLARTTSLIARART